MMGNVFNSKIGMMFDYAHSKVGMIFNKLPQSTFVGMVFYPFYMKVGMVFHYPDIKIGMMGDNFYPAIQRYSFVTAIFDRIAGSRENKAESDKQNNLFHSDLICI